jgi:hypothetical protein
MTDHDTLGVIRDLLAAVQQRMNNLETMLTEQNKVIALMQKDLSQARGGLMFGKWLAGAVVVIVGAGWTLLSHFWTVKTP